MRICSSFALLLLFVGPSGAEPTKMLDQHDALLTNGTTRTSQLRADLRMTATGQVAASAPEVEHDLAPQPARPRPPAGPLSGAVADRVERQMRKNLGSIDSCMVEAAA